MRFYGARQEINALFLLHHGNFNLLFICLQLHMCCRMSTKKVIIYCREVTSIFIFQNPCYKSTKTRCLSLHSQLHTVLNLFMQTKQCDLSLTPPPFLFTFFFINLLELTKRKPDVFRILRHLEWAERWQNPKDQSTHQWHDTPWGNKTKTHQIYRLTTRIKEKKKEHFIHNKKI